MSFDRLQYLFRVYAIIRNRHGSDHRGLPGVKVINFSNRYVEPLAQPVLQAFHHVPLLFQRMRVLDMDLERQNADSRHNSG